MFSWEGFLMNMLFKEHPSVVAPQYWQRTIGVAAGLEKTDFYQLKCIVEQQQIAITKLRVINKR